MTGSRPASCRRRCRSLLVCLLFGALCPVPGRRRAARAGVRADRDGRAPGRPDAHPGRHRRRHRHLCQQLQRACPCSCLLLGACALAAEIVMRRTRYGAQLYAIGGNPEAARLAGINVGRAIFWDFVIAGLRVRHHGRGLDGPRQRRRRGQRRACSSSSTPSRPRSSAAPASPAVVARSWGRCWAPRSWAASTTA